MKRVLLDTNVYGTMLLDEQFNPILYLTKKTDIIIYGMGPIRKELRDTPKKVRLREQNLRNNLLQLYDELTKDRRLLLSPEDEHTARSYFRVYREIGGIGKEKEMWNDLLIVACASRNNLDIVVSQDRGTMLSDKARKAYAIVNGIVNIRTPRFLNYETFKQQIK